MSLLSFLESPPTCRHATIIVVTCDLSGLHTVSATETAPPKGDDSDHSYFTTKQTETKAFAARIATVVRAVRVVSAVVKITYTSGEENYYALQLT